MARNICIHIGAHKAASTTVQSSFRLNSQHFKERYDLDFIGGEHLISTPFASHFMDLASGGLVNDQDYWNSLKSAKNFVESSGVFRKENLFLSWEGVLGHSDLSFYAGMYPHYPRIIESLSEIFEEYSVRVVLVLRHQKDFVESCYLQQIKERNYISFEEFTARIDVKNLQWSRIVDALSERYQNNFFVYPFEAIKLIGASPFIKGLMSYSFDERFAHDDFSIVEQANSSYSGYGVEIVRELLPKLSEKNQVAVNKILFSELSSSKYSKAKLFRDFEGKLINEVCLKDNMYIFSKFFDLIPDMFLAKETKMFVRKAWGCQA